LAVLLFELIERDVDFVWNLDYQQAFEVLKKAFIVATMLIRLDFKKPFYVDVVYTPKGVGAILSEKEGKLERVVAYASKNLTVAQRKFHPMERECYALQTIST
jgi:hypothetical protein